MNKAFKLFGIIALVAIMSLFTSCATATSLGGHPYHRHGLFTSLEDVTNAVGGTEIGSFTVIMGFINQGYAEFAAAVNAALDAGQTVSTVQSMHFFTTRVTAFAR